MNAGKESAAEKALRTERGRAYMNRVLEARQKVWELTERICQCDSMISRCTSVLGTRVQSGRNVGRMEDGILALIRLKERLSEALEGYEARVREAEWAAESLPDPVERSVLRLRYLCGLGFQEISEKLHYADARYVRKLCADALGHLRVPGKGDSVAGEVKGEG